MSENTSIVAAGQKADIGCRVVLWDEPGGMSFYKPKTFSPRSGSLEKLREQVNCFVLHHSVTYTAKLTFSGLIGRGLSVNFIIDDNDVDGYATIYQCLDIKDVGWSHKPLNFAGPGVEISYQPTAWTTPAAYSDDNVKKYGVQHHVAMDDTVHGAKRKVFGPTEAQVKSCIALLAGFCQLFPNAPVEFPKDKDGKIIKTVSKVQKGLLAHFHITNNKVDPMGFPFERVEAEVKAKLQPVVVEEPVEPPTDAAPEEPKADGSFKITIKPGVWNWLKKHLTSARG